MQALTDNQCSLFVPVEFNWVHLIRGVPLAVGATLALLYAMYSLVYFEYQEVIVEPTAPIPTVIMPEVPPIETRFPEPPARPQEQEPLPKLVLQKPELKNPDSGDITFGHTKIDTTTKNFDPFGATAQIMPFIKVAPVYPTAAANRGIEGYVDVMFDVSDLGTTQNIRILAFVPSSIFNKSVLKAVKGWKYKPSRHEGVPVVTPNVQERIRFNMQK
jgi:periplasmic protein TonB